MDIPWKNCKGFCVDNTNVNVGRFNSVKSRALNKNEFFMGCPCHMVHNTATITMTEFGLICKFHVEDFCVDWFYWFEQSTKEKVLMNNFLRFVMLNRGKLLTRFCAVGYLVIFKPAIERVLKQYLPLKSYFLLVDKCGCKKL